jgi:hypothetical protein
MKAKNSSTLLTNIKHMIIRNLNPTHMKLFIKNHFRKIIGVFSGSILGFLYYYFVGCASGICPISSNPYISVIYGGLMGYLFLDAFKKKDKETNEK